MKNVVKRAAYDFITKSLKGKNDIDSITAYLQSKGYSISLYANKDEDVLIKKHDLDARVKIVHAFTLVDGNEKTIYLNDSLSAENKTYSIAHEAGHIILGHIDSNAIVFNNRLQEMEAEAFAHEVLTYKKSYKKVFLVITVLTTVFLLIYSINLMHNARMLKTTNLSPENKVVYITSSGHKYHRENCRYIDRENSTALTEEEAMRTHSPCSVCKP